MKRIKRRREKRVMRNNKTIRILIFKLFKDTFVDKKTFRFMNIFP